MFLGTLGLERVGRFPAPEENLRLSPVERHGTDKHVVAGDFLY